MERKIINLVDLGNVIDTVCGGVGTAHTNIEAVVNPDLCELDMDVPGEIVEELERLNFNLYVLNLNVKRVRYLINALNNE